MWGSKRSSGDTRLHVAAFGRRGKVQNKRRVWENGVYWYTQYPQSNGFSADSRLSLNSADTQNINGANRLSWHLHRGRNVGGYRSGSTKGLNGNKKWKECRWLPFWKDKGLE